MNETDGEVYFRNSSAHPDVPTENNYDIDGCPLTDSSLLHWTTDDVVKTVTNVGTIFFLFWSTSKNECLALKRLRGQLLATMHQKNFGQVSRHWRLTISHLRQIFLFTVCFTWHVSDLFTPTDESIYLSLLVCPYLCIYQIHCDHMYVCTYLSIYLSIYLFSLRAG